MIKVEAVYVLAGLLFAGVAVLSARDKSNRKRWGNGIFWGLFSLSFLLGSRIGDLANGCLVILMVSIAGFGGLGRGSDATPQPPQPRKAMDDRIFIPALTIPVVTVFGSLVLAKLSLFGSPILDPKQATPISLGLGVLAALLVAFLMLRPKPLEPLHAARRLMDAVGWAALLPQSLAALGVLFALAGVGQVIGGIAGHWLPVGDRLAAVATFTMGMALFTMIMGNAFAAFPVMAAAIGLPLIVKGFGGDAAVMGAIGMLSGFCGTLVTPMAANFNVVPTALLELKDRYAIIKVQAPTAALLLIANTLLIYFFAFRR